MRDKPKWTDVAIVVLTLGILGAAVLQTHVFNKQWEEMHAGGMDTRDLAIAAKAQADAAKAQSESTRGLVQSAIDQAKATNKLANEARRSADAAESNAKAAQ